MSLTQLPPIMGGILSGIKKVTETTVTSATSSVSFTGLDLDASKFYMIIATFYNPTANPSFIKLQVNGDTTEGNYINRRIDGSTNGGVSTSLLLDSSMAYCSATSSTSYWGILSRVAGKSPLLMGTCPDPGVASGELVARAGWHWGYIPTSNVTSMNFVSVVAGAIGVDSYISLYSN